MGLLTDYKPVMAMVGLQLIYAIMSLLTRSTLLQGVSPRVLVVYRQGIASIVSALIAYFLQRRNKSTRCSLSLRSFSLIFAASLIGVTINQNIYFEGLYMASSSVAGAMANLIPAITFVIAAVIGFEKVDIRSIRSMAKVVGTIICVSGAACMALLKGPKLLNSEFTQHNSIFLNYSSSSGGDQNWLLGCFLIFGGCCCWAIWLILQVPILACYPDHLALSAWTCFFSTLQCGTLTFFLEPNPESWYLKSSLDISCVLFTGIAGSAISVSVQSWCVSQRGPVFPAMFTPLATVIVTVLACILLHEKLYLGSMAGAVAIIGGLYVVLWGQAKDIKKAKAEMTLSDDHNEPAEVQTDLKKGLPECGWTIDLEESLLDKVSSNTDEKYVNKE